MRALSKNTLATVSGRFKQLSLVLALLSIAIPALATPLVTGNIISWPDDGWYQVQSATNFQTVCEGGTSCEVSADTYIVINHSTGERFENLVVSSAATENPTTSGSPTSSVTVDGATISWPDDGWYQLQSAANYETVCEGGTSCLVSAGTYIAINHTTGERFENLVVAAGDATDTAIPINSNSSSAASITVTVAGSTISWPDDGWYQIQSASNFQTVCEGGTNCQVEPGTYIAINHTTGERFENLVVGSNATDSSSHTDSSTTESDNVASASPAPATFNSRTDSWSIDGNTIDFHTDSFFQVQSERFDANFETVCEGNSSCIVDDGFYQIVNLSTGELWQKVKAGPRPISWSQTGISLATLRWTSVIYNFVPFNLYNIYLNGDLVQTTSGREIVINEFTRGTNYRVSVYGVLADGTEELVERTDVQTTGPSMENVPYGRPATDNNTFGFEVWDLIADEDLTLYPSDCLFALPGGGFCFSPAERFLIGTPYGVSSVTWEFPLPGDNETNHIEALLHFFGTGLSRGSTNAAKHFALLADITTVFAQSQYEISVFNGFGRFEGTFDILENIQFSSSLGVERAINLNGTDLRATVGPERPNPNIFSPDLPRRLHIAGEYYEPNGSGNLSDLSGWSNAGGFLAIIDAETGETLSQTFYPGLTINEVPFE